MGHGVPPPPPWWCGCGCVMFLTVCLVVSSASPRGCGPVMVVVFSSVSECFWIVSSVSPPHPPCGCGPVVVASVSECFLDCF